MRCKDLDIRRIRSTEKVSITKFYKKNVGPSGGPARPCGVNKTAQLIKTRTDQAVTSSPQRYPGLQSEMLVLLAKFLIRAIRIKTDKLPIASIIKSLQVQITTIKSNQLSSRENFCNRRSWFYKTLARKTCNNKFLR
jgi:hypothetical protein